MPNTIQFTQAQTFSTDAMYQSWINNMRSIWTAIGLTQTADSGQVNPATITRAGAATAYEVWKSNDGKTDFYFKVIYALTSGVQPYPTFQLGTGSDGSGNLTGPAGVVGSVSVIATGSNSNAGTYTYQACWEVSGGSFIVAGQYDSSNPWLLCIERDRDAAGAPQSNYLTLYVCQAYNVVTTRHIQKTIFYGVGGYTAGGSPTSSAFVSAMGNAASNAYAGDIGTSMVRPLIPHEGNTSKLLAIAKSGDFATTGQFAMTVYGASHNYMALGNNGLFNTVGPGEMSGCQPCMLWE